jgi:hypothetical protein
VGANVGAVKVAHRARRKLACGARGPHAKRGR